MRVLIVEDDEDLRLSLAGTLRHEGYHVTEASDGATALALAHETEIDIVLLDRDLPVMHGDQVCRALNALKHPAKVLMLTAAATLDDRVSGLDLGADDYLGKPFAYPELLARMRALVRRDAERGASQVLGRAGIALDPTRRLAERDGRPLRLTPKEFGVLESLARADGGFVTVHDLLTRVWDEPDERTRGVVKVAVYSLRRKLGHPDPIVYEAGNGYRLDM